MGEKVFQQPGTRQSHFATVPKAQTERSTFDRSHGHKTTLDAGVLVPVFIDEVLPGDTFDVSATSFARLATPLKPFMDNVNLDCHFFFVPNRLVWDNWAYFMGERAKPDDDPTLLTLPQMEVKIDQNGYGNICNYMGIPYLPDGPVNNVVSVSALYRRAYLLIWNEWFRDQNLTEPAVVDTGDGPDIVNPTVDFCLPRMKRHDYFTSALPWPQKGDAVYIPLGTQAPVITTGSPIQIAIGVSTNQARNIVGGTQANTSGSGDLGYGGTLVGGANNTYLAKNVTDTGFMADLTAATAVSINDLRTSFQIQRLLERDARGGTRYTEILLSHFNVQSPDGRLQRPELLSAGTTSLNVNAVAATFENAEVAQGQLAAYATATGRMGFEKSFTEHGVIIGLVSVRADLNYQQGLERQWSRRTRYDFYWPALSHLGEQAILNKELYLQNSAAPGVDGQVFGYQERYAEYRYKQGLVTGRFKSTDPLSLDVWHLAQDFASLPTLSTSFIAENPPIDRVIAVPGQPQFLLDMFFKMKTTRVMPVYSVPGMIDHF